jgi:IS30 family transposase
MMPFTAKWVSMKSRSTLTQLEREELFNLWLQGGSGGEIARKLGRCRSSINRELNRCVEFLGDAVEPLVLAMRAQQQAIQRRLHGYAKRVRLGSRAEEKNA